VSVNFIQQAVCIEIILFEITEIQEDSSIFGIPKPILPATAMVQQGWALSFLRIHVI